MLPPPRSPKPKHVDQHVPFYKCYISKFETPRRNNGHAIHLLLLTNTQRKKRRRVELEAEPKRQRD